MTTKLDLVDALWELIPSPLQDESVEQSIAESNTWYSNQAATSNYNQQIFIMYFS